MSQLISTKEGREGRVVDLEKSGIENYFLRKYGKTVKLKKMTKKKKLEQRKI